MPSSGWGSRKYHSFHFGACWEQVQQYIVRLVTIILNMIIITVGMATINKISLVVVLIGILLIAAALISWYLRTH
jgi:hypothetical protein